MDKMAPTVNKLARNDVMNLDESANMDATKGGDTRSDKSQANTDDDAAEKMDTNGEEQKDDDKMDEDESNNGDSEDDDSGASSDQNKDDEQNDGDSINKDKINNEEGEDGEGKDEDDGKEKGEGGKDNGKENEDDKEGFTKVGGDTKAEKVKAKKYTSSIRVSRQGPKGTTDWAPGDIRNFIKIINSVDSKALYMNHTGKDERRRLFIYA